MDKLIAYWVDGEDDDVEEDGEDSYGDDVHVECGEVSLGEPSYEYHSNYPSYSPYYPTCVFGEQVDNEVEWVELLVGSEVRFLYLTAVLVYL